MFASGNGEIPKDPSVKVLIIDDSKQVTLFYNKILDQYFDVYVANTIHQSFDMLVSHIFDVIILDYSFNTKIDGIEYSNIIRNTQPSVYTLMYTDERNYDLVKRALNYGSIDKFLNKPVNTKELISIIHAAKKASKSHENIEISMLVKRNKAKSALATVISGTNHKQFVKVEGIILSKDSLPIYSKFVNPKMFQNFSDTLFAGMISALASFGDELFDSLAGLKTLTYGNVSLIFERHEPFDMCFILSNTELIEHEKVASSITSIIDRINLEMKKDFEFMNKLQRNELEFFNVIIDDFQLMLNL